MVQRHQPVSPQQGMGAYDKIGELPLHLAGVSAPPFCIPAETVSDKLPHCIVKRPVNNNVRIRKKAIHEFPCCSRIGP